jgi:hypothetical protein
VRLSAGESGMVVTPMLPELALYALSPTALAHHRTGLAAKAVSLWSRAFRCRADWAAHEAACHAIVARAIEGLAPRRTVVVLGSGLMRDVPLPLLAQAFHRVVLVDAVHLLPVRLKARRYANVSLVTADLSGAIAWLEGRAAQRTNPLAGRCDTVDIDLVISANLASQLGLGLRDWVARKPVRRDRLQADPDDLPLLAAGWHLDDLATLSAPICLLSDLRYEERPVGGAAGEVWPLVPEARLPPPDAGWEWLVAPPGEESADHARIHHAAGWHDLRLAPKQKGRGEPRP